MGRPDGDQGLHDGNPHRPITTPCGSAEDERRADVPFSHDVRREATMFSTRRTTTSEGQDPRPQRPLTCLMQVAVDAQGNVWVGEMHANRLGRLNAQTGAVSSWTPPGAQYGIMTTIVDAQG